MKGVQKMKIIVTGSLGNIGRPLTMELILKGHTVTVISSDPKKQMEIEEIGAKAAIGNLEDVDFLTDTFKGADSVYCMIPMNFKEMDQTGYYRKISNNYVRAIRQNGIGKAVFLSGWAADLIHGFNVNEIHDSLSDIALAEIRPAIFHTNMYSMMDMIRGKGWLAKLLALRFYGIRALLKGQTGMLLSVYGGEDRIALVSPNDIAALVAEELTAPFRGKRIRYVASDELTCNEAAKILGEAIGKPYLKWFVISEKQVMQSLKGFGMPTQLAEDLVKMQSAVHSGEVYENYLKSGPVRGKTPFKEFVGSFAEAYYKN